MAAQLSAYLLKQGKNESVKFIAASNVVSLSLKDALKEMQEVASGSACDKFLYHASINPKDGENLTPAEWVKSISLLEKNLGLEGHQRAIVQHVKDGRTHCHIVWNRVDVDTLTAVRMSHNYRAHELTARELEKEFGLDRVQGAHVEKDGPRPDRQPKQWEMDRGRRSGIDPRKVTAEVSELWAWAQNGADFATALEARGYILAQGDKRDFVIIDQQGNPHSVGRRAGAKAADVRAKLADLDKGDLPTVEQAKEMQEERKEHEAATSLEKSYDRGGMVSQQQAATRHHEQRQKSFDDAAALKRREAEAIKRLEAKGNQQRGQETKQQEEQKQRDQNSVAGRKDQGEQKREERTARTEQTEAKRREAQKNAMQEIFERSFGKGHNANTLERWGRERERDR